MLKRSLTAIIAIIAISFLVFTIWGLSQPQKTQELSLNATPRYENQPFMVGLFAKPTKKTPPDGPNPTEPPVTEPPATEPPATEPPATEPPVQNPPISDSGGGADSNALQTGAAQKLTDQAAQATFASTASETVTPIATNPPIIAQTASPDSVPTPTEESGPGIKNLIYFFGLVLLSIGMVVLSLVTIQKLTGK